MASRFAAAGLLLGALLVGWGSQRAAPSLVRGPYLQRTQPTAMIVRWRTDVASDSQLRYGTSPEAQTEVITSPALTTEHRLEVTGLAPGTAYYYTVGSSAGTLAGGDGNHSFSTAAPADVGRPVRFLAMGDFGTGAVDALAVRDGFLAWNLAQTMGAPVDGWLALGDNAYLSGTDLEYTANLFAVYPPILRNTPFWPCLGNHDALSADSATLTGPYYASFSLPRLGESGGRPSGTEAWYSFDHGPVHLVALDSADSSLAPGSPMLTWLQLDLAQNTRPWTVVFFHHPPYTKGSHDSDNPDDSSGRMIAMRENVLPLLEAAGVDLVLSGHSHGYERSYLLDGHYGPSASFDPAMIVGPGDGNPAGRGAYHKTPGPHGGTVYVVAGGGGAGGPDPLGVHPAHVIQRAGVGALVLEFEGDTARGWFIRPDTTVDDHFAIVHRPAAVFADGFESGTLAAWSEVVPRGRGPV